MARAKRVMAYGISVNALFSFFLVVKLEFPSRFVAWERFRNKSAPSGGEEGKKERRGSLVGAMENHINCHTERLTVGDRATRSAVELK